jgi:hypothetical protein
LAELYVCASCDTHFSSKYVFCSGCNIIQCTSCWLNPLCQTCKFKDFITIPANNIEGSSENGGAASIKLSTAKTDIFKSAKLQLEMNGFNASLGGSRFLDASKRCDNLVVFRRKAARLMKPFYIFQRWKLNASSADLEAIAAHPDFQHTSTWHPHILEKGRICVGEADRIITSHAKAADLSETIMKDYNAVLSLMRFFEHEDDASYYGGIYDAAELWRKNTLPLPSEMNITQATDHLVKTHRLTLLPTTPPKGRTSNSRISKQRSNPRFVRGRQHQYDLW